MEGAHQWIAKRIDILQQGKDDELAQQLKELDEKIVAVQNELDESAGKFVEAENELCELVSVFNIDIIDILNLLMYLCF